MWWVEKCDFSFWFSSFRGMLDISSGVLEPWNSHYKGKIDQKQSYYKTVSSILRDEQKHRRLDIYSDLLREIQQSNVILRMKETWGNSIFPEWAEEKKSTESWIENFLVPEAWENVLSTSKGRQ